MKELLNEIDVKKLCCPICGSPLNEFELSSRETSEGNLIYTGGIKFYCECEYEIDKEGQWGLSCSCPKAHDLFLELKMKGK